MKEIELKMSEMCDLLGITPQAIRLYEKYDAIHSFKFEGNGYRYYYFEDVGPAIHVRNLRKLGFALPKASEMVHGSSVNQMIQALDQQEKEIEKMIAYQKALLTRCQKMKELLPLCQNQLHQYQECMRPAMYFLQCESDGKLLHSKKEKKDMHLWSEHYPFVYYCPMTETKDLNADCVSLIGLCLFEEDQYTFEEVTQTDAQYIPSAKCIGGITKVSENTTDYYSVIQKGLEYLKQNGYELTGNIYSVLLAAGIAYMNEKCDYYYIWYEIK